VSPLADTRGEVVALDPLLDTAPCGFLSLDDAGIVRLANSTLAELVQRPREEVEGHHIDQLLSAAGRIFYTTHLFPLLRLHGHAEELYMPLLRADGTEIPVLASGATKRRSGESVHDLVILPMRQRNQLEDELITARNNAQEASAAKDRFLSIVSHELRTPLTGIAGYADLLLRERRGPLTPEQRVYVERIRDAAQYQVELIADILDFAALDGARRALTPTQVPVEDVLARMEAILAVRAADEERTIDREPKPAPGAVRADRRAMQQILLNIGMNAIKYSPRGSPIAISVESMGDRVQIHVRDRGAGIAPDHLDRIFEPFVQLTGDAGATSKRGVGLGLAISRDLARAMRGEILVASVPGQGSTFTLDLPAA
jgi:signal transduction histidine kinase